MDNQQLNNPQTAGSQTDNRLHSGLKKAADRLKSMMLLYDHLYQSDSYNHANSKVYLETLLNQLDTSLKPSTSIRLDYSIDNILMETKAVTNIAMILNELITNAFKYAFVHAPEGTITVTLADRGDNLELTVQDWHGVANENPVVPEFSQKGLGLTLVELWVQQLEGKLNRAASITGTTYTITLPSKLKQASP